MPNQLIGVSPPLVGKAQDSKVDLKKDFKEASPGQYKTDFEKALKEKLALKEKAAEKQKPDQPEPNPKEARLKKDDDKESKVEKKEGKSSGGTKKKMTEKVDDQMVSKFMASTESEIEIPESTKDLAEIEESQPTQIEAMTVAAPAKTAMMQPQADLLTAQSVIPQTEIAPQPAAPMAIETEAAVETEIPTALIETKVPAMQTEFIPKELMAKTLEEPSAVTAFQPQEFIAPTDVPKLMPQMALAKELPQEEEVQVFPEVSALMEKIKALKPVTTEAIPVPKVEILAPTIMTMAAVGPVVEAAPKAFNLDQELGAAVGFTPTEEKTSAAKPVEGEKIQTSLKAQEFQKSVYDQLQKTEVRQPAAALQSNTGGTEQKQSKPDDLPQKSLKTDQQIDPSQLQHTGQTHGEFKSHVAAAPLAPGSEQRAQQLEANHEKNVQEVLNQAQYLVKKGGGEMKVSMSPDGLAEVQLKVTMQDGKVQVEMNTQDKTVKKLMEDSLTDLKSSLAAQHLNVEHVKINTVSATNTDNSAQFQSNWNGGGGEHQQREFWTQFQDNMSQNNSRRGNYQAGEGGSLKTSVQTSAMPAAAAPRTYGGTKGATVNRVA